MNDQIRVLIVDDHPLVREGLQVVLERFEKLSVVTSVSSGEQAVIACHNLNPDVVLMDVNMPGMSGIDTMVKILSLKPDVKVLMLTSFAEDMRVGEALEKGAIGYLMKNAEIVDLVRAIQNAAVGKHTLSPEAVKSLIHSRPKPMISDQQLTQRERDVLSLIARGFSNRKIGSELSISVSTVKAYTAKIYRKLEVDSRAEAVAKAINERIVTPEER